MADVRRHRFGGWPVLELDIEQVTSYHVGDSGCYQYGPEKRYTVLTLGQYSGSVNLIVASYAAPTISFDQATKVIADSANGLAHILATDTVVIRNSANNEGAVLTVAVGGNAAQFTVNEAINDELAGRYVKIYKQASHSNACVLDDQTGKMWSRVTSFGERVGRTSDGKFRWYRTTFCYTLHAAAADLQMIAGDPATLRIVGGAGEVARYTVGDIYVFSGFANAINKLPGYYVLAVDVNGADLDISLDPMNLTTIAEAAGGARGIKLICSAIYAYAAAARAANLSGYSEDWRIPIDIEMLNLRDMEVPNGLPDAVAFPGWSVDFYWVSGSRPSNWGHGKSVWFSTGDSRYGDKGATPYYAALVRGGIAE